MQSKDINRILSNQNQVNKFISLLHDHDSKLKSPTTITKGWVAPMDRIYNSYDLIELSLTYQDIDSISAIVKLINDKGQKNLHNTSIVNLKPILYPKQVKACPSLKDIKDRLSNESMIATVHSYSGYSFSAEYTHVYQSKFNRETAYDDLAVTIKRALRTVDPMITDDSCTRFSEFMISMAAWESLTAVSTYESTISSLLPAWKDHPKEIDSSASFQYVEIYVGRDAKSNSCDISFTVRIRDQLHVTSGGEVSAIASTATCDFIYYRDIMLDDKAVDSFHHYRALDLMSAPTHVGKGKSKGDYFVQPPPPPKRTTAGGDIINDIRVNLCLTFPHTGVEDDRATQGVEDMGQQAGRPREHHTSDSSAVEQKQKLYLLADETSSTFFSQLLGWGFNASDSLGLGDVSRALRKGEIMARRSSTGGDGSAAAAKDDDDALARDQDLVVGVRLVPLDRIIHIERIKMIACSSTHTLLLTAMGTVYACGNNAEGALGTGDLVSR